jgi:hypothetical protein
VIADAGFCRFVYDPFSRQLQPLSAATQAGSGHNQLWIRDLPFVHQRCRTAAPVRSGCGLRRVSFPASPTTPYVVWWMALFLHTAEMRTGVLCWVFRRLAGCAARFPR